MLETPLDILYTTRYLVEMLKNEFKKLFAELFVSHWCALHNVQYYLGSFFGSSVWVQRQMDVSHTSSACLTSSIILVHQRPPCITIRPAIANKNHFEWRRREKETKFFEANQAKCWAAGWSVTQEDWLFIHKDRWKHTLPVPLHQLSGSLSESALVNGCNIISDDLWKG